MIVGVDLAVAAGATQQFAGMIGDDLVGVHVGGGAGASLKNIKHEVAVEFAVNDFLRCSHDGFGNRWIDGSQVCVRLSCSLFDLSEGTDELAWEAQVANRKIEYGTLGTGTVVGIYWYTHLAH